MKERFYFQDIAVMVLKNAGFDGLVCDPDAFDCNGCSLDRINPDECLNPDCYGGYFNEETGKYQSRRPPR